MTPYVARYRSQIKQWLATLSVTLPMVIIGSLNYMVAYYEMLYRYESGFDRCTAVTIFGGVIGAIIGAISADMAGRRAALFGTIISIICGIIGKFQMSIIGSYISLLVAGISAGIAYTVVPLYVSEIADDKIRGRLLVLPLVGPYISHLVNINVFYDWFYRIQIVFPILFLVTFYWFPETPYHLVLNKKYQLATKSVRFFRGIDEVAAKEDVDEIIATIEADGARPGLWNKIRDLFTGKGRKPLMIITFLVIVQWSSSFVYLPLHFERVVQHMIHLFDEYNAASIVCILLIVWIVFLTFTVDLVGRRFYLLGSTLVGLVMLAISPIMQVHSFAITSVFSLCHFVILAVPFVLIGELFSTNVKGVASVILTIFGMLVKLFAYRIQFDVPELARNLPYLFIAMFLLTFVMVLAFLPETKKMSFAKIQNVLSDNRMKCFKQRNAYK